MFDFIDSSIDVHDLPNVLEARKIRKLVPKHDVSLRVFCDMAPSKKKERKQLSLEARNKKESSSKPLNDIKKSKRKSAKN